jgi:hypothetical protein
MSRNIIVIASTNVTRSSSRASFRLILPLIIMLYICSPTTLARGWIRKELELSQLDICVLLSTTRSGALSCHCMTSWRVSKVVKVKTRTRTMTQCLSLCTCTCSGDRLFESDHDSTSFQERPTQMGLLTSLLW